MIGRRFTSLLLQKGYRVSHLGRTRKRNGVKSYLWDPYKKEIEEDALRDVDVIIHLAGAGIADKRWTEKWKREILLSRTESTRFLYEKLYSVQHRVNTFISASGISYYGLRDNGSAFVETDQPADDFMARVTVAWEKEVDEIARPGLRVVKIRTGVVLSRDGGALEKLVTPVKFLVGAPLGSGKQYINWIHLDDLCGIYIKAIGDDSMRGAYNAVAPEPVTNKRLTEEIAGILKRPLWLPSVPGFMVKAIAGGVAEVVLSGGKISSEKVEKAGFTFQFPTLQEALRDLITDEKRLTQ